MQARSKSQSGATTLKIASLGSSAHGIATLLKLAAPHRTLFAVGLLALAIGSGINLIFPEIVRRLLDPSAFEFVSRRMGLITLGLAGLFVLQGLAFFVRSYLFGLIGQRVYADLRLRLFKALISRQIAFFDANRASELTARINSDAALVQDAVSVKLSVLIRYAIQVVFGVALMVTLSTKLTLALVISVLAMIATSLLFIKRLKSASRRYQTALARFTSFSAESAQAIRVVRTLGAERDLVGCAERYNGQAKQAGEERVVWAARFSSGASALLNVLLLLVAWYGVLLVSQGALALNELAAFVLYGAIVAISFSFLIGAYAELAQSLAGLERVFDLIRDQPQNDSEPRAMISKPEQGVGIVCQDLNFAYPGRLGEAVLRSFSARIEPASFTALVGPSGVGKSSLAQLICRLYEPQDGLISITRADGSVSALSELSEPELRNLVAWVPQEPCLFSFSVYDNLVLGNQIERDEVIKAVREWGFLDFLEPLEGGIDTELGERGSLLSGGQRQRIAIARAMLRRPALLILDEATAALDSQSESQVMRAIAQYLPQSTLLVISHRLSTIYTADRILVIEGGEIVESGTHNELVKLSGLYKKYSERQGLLSH